MTAKKKTCEPLLWSVPEAALEGLGDEKTIRRELEAGKIPGIRQGRNWKIPNWYIKSLRDGPRTGQGDKGAEIAQAPQGAHGAVCGGSRSVT